MKRIIFTFIVIFLFSCDKTTGPVLPDVTTIKDDLSNFQTIIADYDSVVFKSNEDLLLKKKDVTEIILGTKDNYVFEPLQTIVPVFSEVNSKYRLEFEIPTKVDEKTYLKLYALRFIMTDESYIEIDTPVHFYKYPYENAEIFLIYDPGPNGNFVSNIQDFDIVGDYLYYHPYAAFGLFRYNLQTNQPSFVELVSYGGGDHITATNNYVFIDALSFFLKRYNIDADSVDLSFSLLQIPSCVAHSEYNICSNLVISGLATDDETVYVVFDNYESESQLLVKFDFNGNYLSEMALPSQYNNYNLGYYNGILFSYYYDSEAHVYTIKRFDLNSNTFLETKPSPAPSPDGIPIVNGRFYYADYYRNIICSIPISDLMD